MAGPNEALGDGCGLEPVGTGREPWQSTSIDGFSSGFGTMNASGRHVSDFDSRTPIGRFDDSFEPKLVCGRRSALKVPRVDVEAVSRYSADNDEEPFYPRRGKSKVGPENDSDGGSQAGLRGTREPAGTRKGARDTVWPVRRSGNFRNERSRSSSRESVPWNRSAISGLEAPCVAVPNRLVPRAIWTGPTTVDRFVGPHQGTIDLTRLGPLTPDRMLSGWR